MELSIPVERLLQAELRRRYERLCQVHGSENVVPPTPAVVVAFAETCRLSQESDAAAIKRAIQDAGEAYERFLRYWQDPRWRDTALIAKNKRLLNGLAPTLATRQPRFRPCGFYPRELVYTRERTKEGQDSAAALHA